MRMSRAGQTASAIGLERYRRRLTWLGECLTLRCKAQGGNVSATRHGEDAPGNVDEGILHSSSCDAWEGERWIKTHHGGLERRFKGIRWRSRGYGL